MASWNSETGRIESFPDAPSHGYEATWIEIDCGCCVGIEWGGDTPVECRYCKGLGAISKHIQSGVLALYPGGPFVGKQSCKD